MLVRRGWGWEGTEGGDEISDQRHGQPQTDRLVRIQPAPGVIAIEWEA